MSVTGVAVADSVASEGVQDRSARVEPSARSTSHDTWWAFLASRVLVWIVGCCAVAVLGTSVADVQGFDPSGISRSAGPLGNVLLAPAVRWDAVWYLQIAHGGYQSLQDAAFFPLYPTLIRGASLLIGSPALAGVLISLVALVIGMELVRRLTLLELGPAAARVSVLLIAFSPMALYYSAVYTEAVFLALSAGTFYAGRRGRWWLAGALGALASMSRVSGVLLVVPVVLLFLYGPRGDAEPAAAGAWWRPRYRLTPAILWAALIPIGAAAFAGYLALRGWGLDATTHAERIYWERQFVLPLTGVWQGAQTAWAELRLELSNSSPSFAQSDALLQFATLALVVVSLVGVFRRLPVAYGVYVLLSLVQVLCTPPSGRSARRLRPLRERLVPAAHVGRGLGCRAPLPTQARGRIGAAARPRHCPVRDLAVGRIAPIVSAGARIATQSC